MEAEIWQESGEWNKQNQIYCMKTIQKPQEIYLPKSKK